MKTLGIDFGTTKTIASYLENGESKPLSVGLGRSKDAMPTSIHLDEDRQILFGDEADDQAALDYAGYARCFKRGLGTPEIKVLNGTSKSSKDLAQDYLRNVVEISEKDALNAPVEHLVVTCPAAFGPAARADLAEAAVAVMGERGSYELLDEPVAAASAWLKLKGDIGQRVLAFDWGGGTLDIAVLEKQDGSFVAHPELVGGDSKLGGEDVDESILNSIDTELVKTGAKVWSDRTSREKVAIKRVIRTCKEAYAAKDIVRWAFSLEDVVNGKYEFKLARADFNPWIQGVIGEAAGQAQNVLQQAKQMDLNVNCAILIGGTSRLYGVREQLEQTLQIPVISWDRSIEAVSWGAAIKAAEKYSATKRKNSFSSRPPPVEDEFKSEKPFEKQSSAAECEESGALQGNASHKGDQHKSSSSSTANPEATKTEGISSQTSRPTARRVAGGSKIQKKSGTPVFQIIGVFFCLFLLFATFPWGLWFSVPLLYAACVTKFS